jgi:hypothetical protein
LKKIYLLYKEEILMLTMEGIFKFFEEYNRAMEIQRQFYLAHKSMYQKKAPKKSQIERYIKKVSKETKVPIVLVDDKTERENSVLYYLDQGMSQKEAETLVDKELYEDEGTNAITIPSHSTESFVENGHISEKTDLILVKDDQFIRYWGISDIRRSFDPMLVLESVLKHELRHVLQFRVIRNAFGEEGLLRAFEYQKTVEYGNDPMEMDAFLYQYGIAHLPWEQFIDMVAETLGYTKAQSISA